MAVLVVKLVIMMKNVKNDVFMEKWGGLCAGFWLQSKGTGRPKYLTDGKLETGLKTGPNSSYSGRRAGLLGSLVHETGLVPLTTRPPEVMIVPHRPNS